LNMSIERGQDLMNGVDAKERTLVLTALGTCSLVR